MTQDALNTTVIRRILDEDMTYGHTKRDAAERVIVEFVSTNPNGPITVTGGRNAAVGDTLASVLQASGSTVTREYYINDALNSTQMANFGRSVFHAYRKLLGHAAGALESFSDDPDWLYSGDYVTAIARKIADERGAEFEGAAADDPQTVQAFREMAQQGMLAQQQADLAALGVHFDNWFSEDSLHGDGRVRSAIETLTERGYTYVKDGAVWFQSTRFGDDKDRVLVRANGTFTYIAGDAAYHKDKFDRGFDRAVDVWGADHAGYIARTKAVIRAFGYDPARLDILLYQPARIIRYGEFVKTGSRRGDVLELKADLIDEIGRDAARFFYLLQPPSQELSIDLDLAARKDRSNPLFAVQNAHARIASALARAGFGSGGGAELSSSVPSGEPELRLIRKLAAFPDEVGLAARELAPNRIAHYALAVSTLFYEIEYDENDPAAGAEPGRAALLAATLVTLRNALALLGVDAPTNL